MPRNSTYQAWTICEGEGCEYVGDSYWQYKDGEYFYYCPQCKQTYKTTIDPQTERENKHSTLEYG